MKLNRKLPLCFAFTAIAVFAQTKPAFEVATVKPSPPPDMAKLRALVQAGGKMPFGPKVDSGRAEYTGMDLKSLIGLAYGVKAYQITGPDWMEDTPFDIVAKLPDGASTDDAPRMLQTLLEERLKLSAHRVTAEHPVLALVVGKSGLKMKPPAQSSAAEGESPKPGVTTIDMGQGMRMSVDPATGATVVDIGAKGRMSLKMNPATRAMQMELSMMTMGGLADWLTERSTNNDGPQVIDMTELTGRYDASVDMDISPSAPGEPGGAFARMNAQVQALGLKLESRKAMVEMFIIDHVEKTPTGN